jgi:hypothetical protein
MHCACLSTRCLHLQIDVKSAGWPVMAINTYYWIVLSPGQTYTMANGAYNGFLWAGLNSATDQLPQSARDDPDVFTAREMTSQITAGDRFSATLQAGVNFILGAQVGGEGVPWRLVCGLFALVPLSMRV